MFNFAGFLKGLLIRSETDPTKQFILEISPSATTGTTTTLLAAQTADRVVTLPDSSDPISTANAIETLTNKTIDGDVNTLQDIAITSLKADGAAANDFLSRDNSGIVISVIAVPSGDVVGTNGIQTLTNKIIDADSNTITNIRDAEVAPAAAIAVNKLAAQTANMAVATDASGFITPSPTTATELGYVSGVTSAIQTQLNTKVTNPMTTSGDMIYGGSSGSPQRLVGDISNTKKFLTEQSISSVAQPPGWDTVATSDLTGTVAVNQGGTGQTSYTNGQLLIGNTSGNTLTKATLTAGTNITITNGNGSISIASTPGANPAWNFLSKSAAYTALINDWVSLSSTAFSVTLDDAATGPGESIILEHEGANFAVYTVLTTSSQTIIMGGTLYSNADINTNSKFSLRMPGEKIIFFSDGSNWHAEHIANGGADWTTVGTTATLGYSATSAYVFTLSGSHSATEGAVYQRFGGSEVFTVSTTIASAGSMTCSGTATPPTGTNTLNKLSGTGDANIVYTSRTITGVPILGTTSTDSWRYQRDQSNGRYMIVEGYIKGTAAGTAGSGAYVFQIPGSSVAGAGGPTVDTTQVTIAASFPTAAAPGGTGTALETTGFYAVSALTSINNIGGMMIAFPYSPSQVYFDCLYVVNAFSTAQNGWSPWSSSINPFSSNPINVRVRYKVPITGWLP